MQQRAQVVFKPSPMCLVLSFKLNDTQKTSVNPCVSPNPLIFEDFQVHLHGRGFANVCVSTHQDVVLPGYEWTGPDVSPVTDRTACLFLNWVLKGMSRPQRPILSCTTKSVIFTAQVQACWVSNPVEQSFCALQNLKICQNLLSHKLSQPTWTCYNKSRLTLNPLILAEASSFH